MKKTSYSKLLSISLAASFILVSSTMVQAVMNRSNLDYNSNGIVDTEDLYSLATNYNLKSSDANWNSEYDLNSDNVVDIFDLVKVSKSIGTIPDDTDITSKFTDINFKTAVYNLIGKTSPYPILYSDVKNISYVNVSSKNISSLSGIEYFTALTSLSCRGIYDDNSSNKLITLNLSNNKKLVDLDCSYNKLTALDISENIALTSIACYYNQLTSLNLYNNTSLTSLACGCNKLVTLDISKNIALTNLNCSYNQLKTLYSIKNTWDNNYYKTQYIDSTNTTTTDNLVITIKS